MGRRSSSAAVSELFAGLVIKVLRAMAAFAVFKGTQVAAAAVEPTDPPAGRGILGSIVNLVDAEVPVRGLTMDLEDWHRLDDWTAKEPGSFYRWGTAELPIRFHSGRDSRWFPEGSGPPQIFSKPEFETRHWSVTDGLPHDKIRAVKVARDGSLWLGTVEGLVRVRGERFEVFHATNSPALRSAGWVVRAIAEGGNGDLCFATEGGLLRHSTAGLEVIPGTTNLTGILQLLPARHGGFWLVGSQGLAAWREGPVRWMTVPGLGDLKAIEEDQQGRLWLGGVGGVVVWDPVLKREVARYLSQMPLEGRTVTNLIVRSIRRDQQGVVWMASTAGLWRVPEGGGEAQSFDNSVGRYPAGPRGSRLTLTAAGRLWVTSDGPEDAAFILNGEKEGYRFARAALVGQPQAIDCDADGSAWIGARDGLYRISPKAFRTLTPGGWIQTIHSIAAIAEGEDGAMIFGGPYHFGRWSGGGVEILETTAYSLLFGGSHLLPGRNSSFRTVGPTGWSLELDFSASQAESPVLGLHQQGVPAGVTAVAVGHGGRPYLGTPQGIFVEDPASPGRWKLLEGSGALSVEALVVDHTGDLWLAAKGLGIGKIERQGGGVFWVAGSENLGPAEGLAAGARGVVWVGTPFGLGRVRNGNFHRVTVEGRHTTRGWGGLLEDRRGDLWVNASEGLLRLQGEHLTQLDSNPGKAVRASVHGPADGVRPHDGPSHSQSALEDRSGHLWFARNSGLVRVEPWLVPRDRGEPVGHLERAVADGHPLSLTSNGALTVMPRADRLTFYFTAYGSAVLESLQFQYRLEGFDAEWRNAGAAREVDYAGLAPGTYTFRLRARSRFTDWGTDQGGWRIEVVTPLWSTRGFRLGVLMGVGVGAWILILKLRERARREAASRGAAALAEERSRIARAMHDHLGPRIASLSLADGAPEVSHRRAREALRELNDVIWEVDPDYDSLEGMADFVASFASRYLRAVGLSLRLKVDPHLPNVALAAGVRRELAAVFKESLRNVAQHARARRVTVEFSAAGGQIELKVSDDGCGFRWPLSEQELARLQAGRALDGSTGGLLGFGERMRALGGSCRIESTKGAGTCISFSCPLELWIDHTAAPSSEGT